MAHCRSIAGDSAAAPVGHRRRQSSIVNRQSSIRSASAGQSPIPNPPSAAAPFRVLGQAGGSYIVLEDDSGVKLIDQHALHERVLFELFLKRAAATASGDSQGLLTPVILELTPIQSSAYAEGDATRELLQHLGFDTAPF